LKPFLTILLAAFTLGLPLVFGQLACDYHPVSTVIAPPPPTFTPTFTPTSTPILVYVDLTASAFSPAAVTVAYSPTGSSGVVFTNLDGFPHTVQPDDGTGSTANSPVRELRKEIRDLKRVLAEKALEVDFFKGALQKVAARRRSGSGSGGTASTTKCGS